MFSTGDYGFSIWENNISQEKAFNNAFRHYKNFYFSTISETLHHKNQSPGLDTLSKCPFNHSIEDEATGELAQLLELESPITYSPQLPSGERVALVRTYRVHHVYLRAVKKLYKAKFRRRQQIYNLFLNAENNQWQIDIDTQVPLPTEEFKADYQTAHPGARNIDRIVLAEQEISLQRQMRHPTRSEFSHWPATVFDINYFLERANFSIPILDQEQHYGEIGNCTQSVAQAVGLWDQLQASEQVAHYGAVSRVPHWSSRQQNDLIAPILQRYSPQQSRPQGSEIDASSNEHIEASSSSNIQPAFTRLSLYSDPDEMTSYSQGIPPPGGSISISRNTGAFGEASFWVVSLFLFGYLYHKISEFWSSKNPPQKIVLKNALNPKI